MSDVQPEPELRWAPIPPAPKRRGRAWLIVGLSVLAVAIVAALLFFVLPRDPNPAPSPSASPSPTASETATPTPTPEPTETPQQTAPPVPDPDLPAFTARVQPRLDDAVTGLGFLPGMSGPDAAQIVDQLQQDAEVFASTVAPSSLASDWSSAVADYASALTALRSAYDGGASTAAPLDAASAAVQTLRTIAGL